MAARWPSRKPGAGGVSATAPSCPAATDPPLSSLLVSRRAGRCPTLRRGLCNGLLTPQRVYALRTWLPEKVLEKPRAYSSGRGGEGWRPDGETLTTSQEEASSPLLQESPREDLGAIREEEATEPALTLKARGPSPPKPWPSAGPAALWIVWLWSWCSYC